MSSKQRLANALIFIDTNILLDFYRIRRTDISLKYLEQIDRHRDIIIMSSQVEMEFKKNRQIAILESIVQVKKINNINLSVPAILTDAKPVEMLKKHQQSIDTQQKKLKKRIENVLTKPIDHDLVFKSLQKLFEHQSSINLNRENKERFAIRKLAGKRFILGYPPRKTNDTSIGDAINWEWIIKCAKTTGKNIIIVSRDSDFGVQYENESYLNDWLRQEFKQRISRKRKIFLTEKLSKAFELVEIPVTKEMIEEENTIIETKRQVLLTAEEFNIRLQKLKEQFEAFKNIEL